MAGMWSVLILGHQGFYHPRIRELHWYGPVSGAAWVVAHRLAKLLAARVVPVRSLDGHEWVPLVLEGEVAPEWLRGLRFDPYEETA